MKEQENSQESFGCDYRDDVTLETIKIIRKERGLDLDEDWKLIDGLGLSIFT